MSILRERLQPVLLANTSDEPAQVAVKGELTSLLSTTTTLVGGATYTSATIACAIYRYLVGTCYADVAGIIYFDFSNDDGMNFDGEVSKALNAGEKLCFEIRRCGKYVRVRFINGASDQTTFRLYVLGE